MKIYSFYHLNLMFSSISKNERSNVVEKCYWPLLRLCENDYKIGIELTGLTLEIINDIDKKWISKFKSLIKKNKVELIGSGYSQIIGPLVPHEVNQWNQKLGIQTYIEILGERPETALVNEMAYSSGLLDHYINNGYSNVIMEINNSFDLNIEWKNNRPSKVENQSGKSINIIWADSIAFQKFQRFVSKDETFKNYNLYINNYSCEYMPLYSSDAEIFDYRPGRFKEESILSDSISEWNLIEKIYKHLNNSNHNFIFPRDISVINSNTTTCKIESAQKPIVVKKQNKYNINRWALSGRNDQMLNTLCYNFFHKIKKLTSDEPWKKLCFIWSSDFRTHISDDRWNELMELINSISKEFKLKTNSEKQIFSSEKEIFFNERFIELKNNNLELIVDSKKGLTINRFSNKKSKKSLLGKIQHGFFDEIKYGFDYFSGHSIIERLGKRKVTDLENNRLQYFKNDKSTVLKTKNDNPEYLIQSELHFNDNDITILKKIECQKRELALINPFIFTFIPGSWDQDSLFYSTNNGGDKIESYRLKDSFSHSERHSYLISSINGFGNTEGILTIGDKFKAVKFEIDLSKSFLIPTIMYEKTHNSFLLRLSYSAQEIDETFRESENKQFIESKIRITIL